MVNNPILINKGPVFGIRYVQAILLFLCLIVNYIGRQNAFIGVVAMTNANSTNPDFPEYDWNKTQQSYILSSFYWGYSIAQFPASYVCRQIGSKLSMIIATLGSALLAVVIPMSIEIGGWQIYCAIRTLQGLSQGLLFPTLHDHLAKWSPIEERTRLGALSLAGLEMGNLLGMAIPGIIAHSRWGWPGISYFSAGFAVVWCALWMIFADNNPVVSRFISPEEKTYILTSQQRNDGKQRKIPVPWRAILTSVPFGSLIIVQIASIWGIATMQSQVPTHLHSVFRMDIQTNSLFSGLPYVLMLAMAYVYLILADTLLKRNIFSLAVTKKTINSIAMWVPAVSLICLGMLNENQMTLAIVLMTITIGISGGVSIGNGLNAIDLSANHAVVLMGILNTFTSLSNMMAPVFAGIIIDDETNRSQWQIVFWTAALVYFFGNLQFIILSTTDTQPWNAEKYDKNFVKQSSSGKVKSVSQICDGI